MWTRTGRGDLDEIPTLIPPRATRTTCKRPTSSWVWIEYTAPDGEGRMTETQRGQFFSRIEYGDHANQNHQGSLVSSGAVDSVGSIPYDRYYVPLHILDSESAVGVPILAVEGRCYHYVKECTDRPHQEGQWHCNPRTRPGGSPPTPTGRRRSSILHGDAPK